MPVREIWGKIGIVFALLTLILPFGTVKARADESISVTLSFGSIRAEYCDEYIKPTDHTVIEEFYERRINAPLREKIACIEENLSDGFSPKASVLYTLPLLERTVNSIISKIDRPSEDATISFKPYNASPFTLTDEKVGYKTDEERVYYDIYKALKQSGKASVTIRPEVIEPKITRARLEKQTFIRAQFSTDYSSSNENRKHNITLALSRISGTVVKAGEEFSFNKTVGERKAQNGFAESKIIVGGEYVDGVGGGVCQVSTTLYNCVLLAGLKVTAVKNHSLPPSYISPSFDAMVSGEYSDLKFRNDSGADIYIYAHGDGETATVRIYGLKNKYRIVRESKIVSFAPPPPDKIITDETGEYGTSETENSVRVKWGVRGVTSEGYLLYYDGKTLLSRERIRKDIYLPQQGIVAIKPKTIQNSL